MIALAYVRKHWRGLGCLLLLALAFLAGWSSRPPVVQVREVERVVTKTVEVEKIVEVAAKQAAKVERVIVYRDREVKPDGTVREREVEASTTASVEHELLATSRVEQREQLVDRRVEKTITPVVHDWRAGSLFGVSRERRPVMGLYAERRVIGNLSAGAWWKNDGSFGGMLSVEF